MKRTVLVVLLVLVFVLGLIVGSTVRPHSVAAATGSVEPWGLIENPNGSVYKVLVLYDPSTGEIWGYQETEASNFRPFGLVNSPKSVSQSSSSLDKADRF